MNIQPVKSQLGDFERHILNVETRLGRIAIGNLVGGEDTNEIDNPTSEQRNYRWKRFHILEQRIRRIKIHAAKMRIIGFEILANVGEPDDSEEEV
jgi:hypothetical protein